MSYEFFKRNATFFLVGGSIKFSSKFEQNNILLCVKQIYALAIIMLAILCIYIL
jgi:hypothetical protein